ncbi:MAG: CARDB domain-containing protein [Solirubrobacteraceae bacterium]
MSRYLLVGSAAVVLALSAATTAGANPAASRVSLTRFVCQPALEPAQREISVRAVMRPVVGTQRMAMRFELLKRTRPGGPVTEVTGRDLGNWTTPTKPTLGQRPNDQWRVDHPVIGLAAAVSYRFRVTFRWTGTHGKVLAAVQRQSRACAQPELRPDLVVQTIAIRPIPNKPARNEYIALIRNRGASSAGPFEILFSPGGANSVQTRTVPLLRAHSRREEAFVGPACTAATAPTVTVDPNDQVDDIDRSNNSLTATCPASSPVITSLSPRQTAIRAPLHSIAR